MSVTGSFGSGLAEEPPTEEEWDAGAFERINELELEHAINKRHKSEEALLAVHGDLERWKRRAELLEAELAAARQNTLVSKEVVLALFRQILSNDVGGIQEGVDAMLAPLRAFIDEQVAELPYGTSVTLKGHDVTYDVKHEWARLKPMFAIDIRV